jgi:hypothetical protein
MVQELAEDAKELMLRGKEPSSLEAVRIDLEEVHEF